MILRPSIALGHAVLIAALVTSVVSCSSGQDDPPSCNERTCPVGTCIADRCVQTDTGGSDSGADADATSDADVVIEVIGEDEISGLDDSDVPDAEQLGALGEGCTSNADCLSGRCIDGFAPGDRICTVACLTESACVCEPGVSCGDFECRITPGGGGDLEQICYPVLPFLCAPCTSDLACGVGGHCVAQANGTFCATPCATGRACDEGYVCDATNVPGPDETIIAVELCVPANGLCNPHEETGGLNALSVQMSSARFTLTGRITMGPRVMSGGRFVMVGGL